MKKKQKPEEIRAYEDINENILNIITPSGLILQIPLPMWGRISGKFIIYQNIPFGIF